MIGQLTDKRYRILKVIGTNALGQTYLAADTRRPGYPQCVVRELRLPGKSSQTPQILKVLFQRKAEIIEKLGKHDKIPALLAYFEENQNLYLVEELVVGPPLSQELVAGKPWADEQIIALLEEVLEILAFVHEQGMIHRSIQPDHLIRRQSDNKLVAIGFGLDKEISVQLSHAKSLAVRAARRSKLTPSQSVEEETVVLEEETPKPASPAEGKEAEAREATPATDPANPPATQEETPKKTTEVSIYEPPEQAQGNLRFNSDIYALGIIAIQAVTGLSPREIAALKSKSSMDKEGTFSWREGIGISTALADIINKMVLPGEQRYQSASEVLADLKELSPPSPVTSPPQTILTPVMSEPLPQTRNKIVPLIWVGLGVILLLGAGLFYLWQFQAPAKAKEFFARAAEKAKRGDKAGAIADYTLAIQLNSKNAEAYYKRANIHYDLQAYQAAIQDYTNAIQANPKLTQAYYNRGLTYLDLNDKRNAVQDFTQVIQLNPNDADAYYKRALGYYELGDYKTATEDYSQAIRLNPNDAAAYSNRGLARSAAGDKQGAMADFTQAIQLNPQQASVYYSRGRARFNLADYQGAVEDFTQAIALDANQADAYTNRCSAYLNLATYNKAIEDCSQAIVLDPRDEAAYNNRCIAYLNLGNYQKASEDCSLTIGINTQNAKAYSNRGLARSATGDKEGAIEDFTAAIRLNPNDSVAYSNRGIVYSDLKNYEAAIADFAQSLRLNPSNATAYYSRGLVRRELKDRVGAIEDFQKAATLFLEQGRADGYKNAQSQISQVQ